MALGAEPFYGLDGSLYMVYGSGAPGSIRIVQLNESSGRLPTMAQPQDGEYAQASYHHVASGPNFQLLEDSTAPPLYPAAYLHGKVRPGPENASYIRNGFVLPVNSSGRATYFLFVDWYADDRRGVPATGNESLARVYAGRSVGSPLGPYLDRDGNDMKLRRAVILGDRRTIHVLSAQWGANCDGVGYDVRDAARSVCENRAACNWTLRYQELDTIDPLSYSNMDRSGASVVDQLSGTPNAMADHAGCPRSMNISYRCTNSGTILYEGEDADTISHIYIAPEAANGSTAQLKCTTPVPVLLPGGSLFADSELLGGNLHFKGVSHAGIFSYEREGEAISTIIAPIPMPNHSAQPERLTPHTGTASTVFTFQYSTNSSSKTQLGASRVAFDDSGWPVLARDRSGDWEACGTHGQKYASSTATLTHCRHHSARGWHCIGDSLRGTHPLVGMAGPEDDLLHGRIDDEGSAAWWREQTDHCARLVALFASCTTPSRVTPPFGTDALRHLRRQSPRGDNTRQAT
jgi:hypothetical protein